jgi:hypothetical protein
MELLKLSASVIVSFLDIGRNDTRLDGNLHLFGVAWLDCSE